MRKKNIKKNEKNLENVLTRKKKSSILTIVPERCSIYHKNGRIAQLGEHLPYKQGVIGSSPIVPTNTTQEKSAGMAQW